MTTEKIIEKIDAIAEKAKTFIKDADATLQQAAAKGAEVLKETTEKVNTGASRVEQAMAEGIEEAAHSVQDAATKAGNAVSETAEKVAHRAHEAATKAGNAVKEAVAPVTKALEKKST
jgi:DNA-binding ferritin-like protein